MWKEANCLSVCQTFQVLTRSYSRTLGVLEGEPELKLLTHILKSVIKKKNVLECSQGQERRSICLSSIYIDKIKINLI